MQLTAAPCACPVLGTGVGQVYLADNTVTGCVIASALALCSPFSALMAVTGSAIGVSVSALDNVYGIDTCVSHCYVVQINIMHLYYFT